MNAAFGTGAWPAFADEQTLNLDHFANVTSLGVKTRTSTLGSAGSPQPNPTTHAIQNAS